MKIIFPKHMTLYMALQWLQRRGLTLVVRQIGRDRAKRLEAA